MKTWKKATLIVLGMIAIAVGVASCGEATGDAPVTGNDKSGAAQFQMPDGFSNFAAKCDGPNMVYTLYHGGGSYGGIAVAPNDPRCVGDAG